MIAILSLIAGFVSPWISDVFKIFQSKQENAHELAMLRESNKSAREISELNAQVGMANAAVEDVKSARAAQPSYGAKLLDTVASADTWVERFFIRPVLLLCFTVVEILNALMRPYAIYIILTMWASTKVARFYFAYTSTGGGASLDLAALAGAALDIWDEHDWAALDYVLGFLLGSRHKLKESGQR